MAIERPPSGPSTDPMTFFHDMNALRTDDPALAEPIERMLARMIDIVIAAFLYAVVSLSVYAMITDPPPAVVTGPGNAVNSEPENGVVPETIRPPRNLRESWISATIGMACALGFLAALEVTIARSLGKRALKLRIVQSEGSNPHLRARPGFVSRHLACHCCSFLLPGTLLPTVACA